MKKPEKPRFDDITGFLSRWFGSKPKAANKLRVNSRWKPAPFNSTPLPENLDPADKLKSLATDQTSEHAAVLDTGPSQLQQAQARLYRPNVQFSRALQEKPRQNDVPAVTPVLKSAPAAPPPDQPAAKSAKSGEDSWRFLDFKKILPTFWTIASLLSVFINVILILIVLFLGRELFVLKNLVGEKLLGGLYENFIYMDQAHIQTSISVSENVPISFTLPISQDTTVMLTQNTPINNANVRIVTGGLTINSPANIILPAGTTLPIHLEMNVPVTTSVPINIRVPVDIPLAQTDLHKPFIGLQQVVAPFYNMLQPEIKTPQDLWLCKPFAGFCGIYFQK